MSLDYAYTADFDWKATSQDASIVERVGNLIQNANTHNVTGSLNFAKLYKDTKFENLFLKKKNRTKKVTSPDGKLQTPNQVSVRKRKKQPLGRKVIKGFYDLITSVKTGKINMVIKCLLLYKGFPTKDETVKTIYNSLNNTILSRVSNKIFNNKRRPTKF